MHDEPLKTSDLKKIGERMDQIFEDLVRQSRPLLMRGEKSWVPAVDIYETIDEILILVELAGVARDEISVVFVDNILRISGARADGIPDPKVRLHQMEIDFGVFQRSIRIGVPIESEKITSKYNEGFLLIRVPKRRPEPSRLVPIAEDKVVGKDNG